MVIMWCFEQILLENFRVTRSLKAEGQNTVEYIYWALLSSTTSPNTLRGLSLLSVPYRWVANQGIER